MAINWFEGGRRITWLLMAIPAMIGGYNAYNHSPSRVVFLTASPRDGWHFDEYPYAASNLDSCAEVKNLDDFQIKEGLVRDVALCFNPNAEGQIVYFSASEEADRLKKLDAASVRAGASGRMEAARALSREASRVRKTATGETIAKIPPDYEAIAAEFGGVVETAPQKTTDPIDLTGNSYDAEVINYLNRRVADFAVSPEMLSAIEKSLPQIEREALFDHLKTTLSLTAYWMGGIWIFSFVLGWIVRGFAGVPRGQDFKPDIKK